MKLAQRRWMDQFVNSGTVKSQVKKFVYSKIESPLLILTIGQ